jgi:hypothetical protein
MRILFFLSPIYHKKLDQSLIHPLKITGAKKALKYGEKATISKKLDKIRL